MFEPPVGHWVHIVLPMYALYFFSLISFKVGSFVEDPRHRKSQILSLFHIPMS